MGYCPVALFGYGSNCKLVLIDLKCNTYFIFYFSGEWTLLSSVRSSMIAQNTSLLVFLYQQWSITRYQCIIDLRHCIVKAINSLIGQWSEARTVSPWGEAILHLSISLTLLQPWNHLWGEPLIFVHANSFACFGLFHFRVTERLLLKWAPLLSLISSKLQQVLRKVHKNQVSWIDRVVSVF